jgi:LmbE family N-acetylglucosaminyl deacetylase
LVVVAHPDDETFGCGSVIADAAAGGAHVIVCCATRGERGDVAPDQPLEGSLGELRVRELRDAGGLLGAEEFVLLDFVDSGMAGEALAGTLAGAPIESVVTAIGAVLARVDPDVVVTLDATGGDGHRDHARIGLATAEAVRRAATGATLYYWCLLRSLLLRWIQAQRQANPGSGHLQLDSFQLGRPDEEITTVIDVGRHRELRHRAIQIHASQRSPYEGMPNDLTDAFLRYDRLVRVEPPWSGGQIETALQVRNREAAPGPSV